MTVATTTPRIGPLTPPPSRPSSRLSAGKIDSLLKSFTIAGNKWLAGFFTSLGPADDWPRRAELGPIHPPQSEHRMLFYRVHSHGPCRRSTNFGLAVCYRPP